MDKLHVALTSACVVAVLVAAHALVAGRQWEQRVHAAEAHADSTNRVVDSLETVATKAEANAARRDTVRITLTTLIAHTDSVSRPDSTCTASLVVRDSIIAVGAEEIADLSRQASAQMRALAAVTAQRDTVRAALDARPRAGAIALEFLHPSLHLSLQAMVYPQARVGVGVSFDLASIRL